MAPYRHARVLDIGGGHAQVQPPLVSKGHKVTVLISSPAAGECLAESGVESDVVIGNLTRTPFEDRSFDVVTSFRMMAHIGDWRGFLAELCRISDDAVIVDFPITSGISAWGQRLFWAKKLVEKDTRHYDSIDTADVIAVLNENGFQVDGQVGQFVLPMALHRMLKSPGLSNRLEALFAPLASRHGNPVILRARRRRD